jgi:PAT family beta-lactamase induction signal transducer AmpG
MFLYFALAWSAGDPRILVAKVVLEAFAEAMADAAFITYLSGLCATAYTATQYALLSSLAAVGLRTLGGLSGFLAEALGWLWFYGLTIFAALPAMLIMLHLLRRFPGGPAARTVE